MRQTGVRFGLWQGISATTLLADLDVAGSSKTRPNKSELGRRLAGYHGGGRLATAKGGVAAVQVDGQSSVEVVVVVVLSGVGRWHTGSELKGGLSEEVGGGEKEFTGAEREQAGAGQARPTPGSRTCAGRGARQREGAHDGGGDGAASSADVPCIDGR